MSDESAIETEPDGINDGDEMTEETETSFDYKEPASDSEDDGYERNEEDFDTWSPQWCSSSD